MRNPYNALLALLPQRPLLIADVLEISDGVATVQLLGGTGTLLARGDANVGDRVFVRDGNIEGQAPTLDYLEISV